MTLDFFQVVAYSWLDCKKWNERRERLTKSLHNVFRTTSKGWKTRLRFCLFLWEKLSWNGFFHVVKRRVEQPPMQSAVVNWRAGRIFTGFKTGKCFPRRETGISPRFSCENFPLRENPWQRIVAQWEESYENLTNVWNFLHEFRISLSFSQIFCRGYFLVRGSLMNQNTFCVFR